MPPRWYHCQMKSKVDFPFGNRAEVGLPTKQKANRTEPVGLPVKHLWSSLTHVHVDSYTCAHTGPMWVHMGWVHMGLIWTHMGPYRLIWGPYVSTWGPYGSTWTHMASIWSRYGSIWAPHGAHMNPYKAQMDPYGAHNGLEVPENLVEHLLPGLRCPCDTRVVRLGVKHLIERRKHT